VISRIDVLAKPLNAQVLEREASSFFNPADLIGGVEGLEQIPFGYTSTSLGLSSMLSTMLGILPD